MGRLFVLQVCPNTYQQTLTRWLAEESRITVLTAARLQHVLRSDNTIREIEFTMGGARYTVRPRGVVDATGSAAVARLLSNAHLLAGSERAACGLILRLKNVAPFALAFPKGVGLVRALRAAADSGELPPECRHIWLDAGIDDDEAFIKLHVPRTVATSAAGDQPRYESARQTTAAVVALLQRFPDFANAAVVQTGSLGIRDGGRIRGRYTLTADDVRQGRKFRDVAARGVWPIEYWDSESGVSIEYLPGSQAYDIPIDCLRLVGIENYWAAGKCLSADRYAHASARIAGTCWAMGQAVGAAAALHDATTKEQCGEDEPRRPFSYRRPAPARSARDHGHEARSDVLVPPVG